MELLLFRVTVDDAYISYRYSQNLASGHGLVWNPGEDPVEGYTNFLWVIVGAVVTKLGLPLPLSMKLIGIGLSVAAVVLMYRITRLISPPQDTAIMPAVLFAAVPALALWAVAGLETALFICLLLVSLLVFLHEEQAQGQTRTVFWSGLPLALLALTRPEGIVVFAALVGLRLLLWLRRGVPRRQLVVYLAWTIAFGIMWLIYYAWRWSYFGYPFPNTAYVKVESTYSGIARTIGVYLIPYTLQIFPFLMLALLALGQNEELATNDRYLLATVAALLLTNFIAFDWMPGYRLALPMTPVLLLLARRPLESMLQAVRQGKRMRRLASAVLLLGLVLYTTGPLIYTGNLFHRVMAIQSDMNVYRWAEEMQTIVDDQYVAVGKWLADQAPPGSSLVASNVGAVGYYGGVRVIDTIGLTDEHIAHHSWTVDSLLAQNPTYIMLESDTPFGFGGLYGTAGEAFESTPAFRNQYELVFMLDNGRTNESPLFIHYLPHATWLYARKDAGSGTAPSQSSGVPVPSPGSEQAETTR